MLEPSWVAYLLLELSGKRTELNTPTRPHGKSNQSKTKQGETKAKHTNEKPEGWGQESWPRVPVLGRVGTMYLDLSLFSSAHFSWISQIGESERRLLVPEITYLPAQTLCKGHKGQPCFCHWRKDSSSETRNFATESVQGNEFLFPSMLGDGGNNSILKAPTILLIV